MKQGATGPSYVNALHGEDDRLELAGQRHWPAARRITPQGAAFWAVIADAEPDGGATFRIWLPA